MKFRFFEVFFFVFCVGLSFQACRTVNGNSEDLSENRRKSPVISTLQIGLISDLENAFPKFSSIRSDKVEDYLRLLLSATYSERDAVVAALGGFIKRLSKYFPSDSGDSSLAFSHFLANQESFDDGIEQAKYLAILKFACSDANGPATCFTLTSGLPDPLGLRDTFLGMKNSFLTAGEFGKTGEGRNIVYAEVTDPEVEKTEKSVIWLSGGIHANEPINILVLTEFARRLSTTKNPEVLGWLRKYRFIIAPLLNPDGWNISSKNTSWRKNARSFGKDKLVGGVNLNRNFPTSFPGPIAPIEKMIDWNYARPTPGSEPETQSIMTFIKSLNPVVAVDYHSNAHILVIPDSAVAEGGYSGIFRAFSEELGNQQATEKNELRRYRFGASKDLFKERVGGTLQEWIWEACGALSMTLEHLSPEGAGGVVSSWPAENLRNNVVNNAWDTLVTLIQFTERHSIKAVINAPDRANIQFSMRQHGSNDVPKFRFPLQNSSGLLHTTSLPDLPLDLLLFRNGTLVKQISLRGERPLNLGDIDM